MTGKDGLDEKRAADDSLGAPGNGDRVGLGDDAVVGKCGEEEDGK
jgi:hypothetical protein